MEDLDTATLLGWFHRSSPYADFDPTAYPEQVEGWHSRSPLFHALLEAVQPRLYIEVGSWLGASALHVAAWLDANRPHCPILCIDTWLGAREFWEDIAHDPRHEALRLRHGYPGVYYQFLANVLHHKAEGRIVPLPQTSLSAARLLAGRSVEADLIYIDASHEPGDVLADLKAYWPLLRPGGTLFGDDYDAYWPGVVEDVQGFAAEARLSVETREGFWILRKPVSGAPQPVPAGSTATWQATAQLSAAQALLQARIEALKAQHSVALGQRARELKRLRQLLHTERGEATAQKAKAEAAEKRRLGMEADLVQQTRLQRRQRAEKEALQKQVRVLEQQCESYRHQLKTLYAQRLEPDTAS